MPPGRNARNTNSSSITYMSRSVTPLKARKKFSKAPDREAGDNRTGDAAEAPDDADDQALDRNRNDQQGRKHAHRGTDHGAREPAQHARDDECERVRAVQADTGELRRNRLLRDRAGRDAEPGAIEHEQEHAHGDQREHEDEDQIAPQPEIAPLDIDVREERRVWLGHPVGRVDHDLVDQDQHADRRHQRSQGARERNEAEIGEVDQECDRTRRNGGDEEGDQGWQRHIGGHGDADVGAGDGSRAIGQVDLVHHAENEGEANADERVDGTEQQAVGDRLKEVEPIHPIIPR